MPAASRDRLSAFTSRSTRVPTSRQPGRGSPPPGPLDDLGPFDRVALRLAEGLRLVTEPAVLGPRRLGRVGRRPPGPMGADRAGRGRALRPRQDPQRSST